MLLCGKSLRPHDDWWISSSNFSPKMGTCGALHWKHDAALSSAWWGFDLTRVMFLLQHVGVKSCSELRVGHMKLAPDVTVWQPPRCADHTGCARRLIYRIINCLIALRVARKYDDNVKVLTARGANRDLICPPACWEAFSWDIMNEKEMCMKALSGGDSDIEPRSLQVFHTLTSSLITHHFSWHTESNVEVSGSSSWLSLFISLWYFCLFVLLIFTCNNLWLCKSVSTMRVWRVPIHFLSTGFYFSLFSHLQVWTGSETEVHWAPVKHMFTCPTWSPAGAGCISTNSTFIRSPAVLLCRTRHRLSVIF